MFVAEPGITLLCAYSVSRRNLQLGWNIKLDSENTDARGVRCDDETIWVADADDDLLYAYGGLNTTPAFPQSTVEFLVHETIAAGSMVGAVPSATDAEGDKMTYWALGPIAAHFTVRDNRWNCQGRLKSNYFQDMDGNPTQIRVVPQNVDQTELTYALDESGSWMSDQTYHRWSGDATGPNNEPTEVTYQRMKFEMDLYNFQAHGGSGGRGTVLIDGANGFGEQAE